MTLSLWQRSWLKEPARRHLCVNTFCRRIGCPRWVLRIGSNYCESTCLDCRNSLHRIQHQPRRSQKRIKYCEKQKRLHRVHPNRMSLRCSACHTRLDTYKSKHGKRVKKQRMLDVGLQKSPHNRLQQHGIQEPCRRRRQYQPRRRRLRLRRAAAARTAAAAVWGRRRQGP